MRRICNEPPAPPVRGAAPQGGDPRHPTARLGGTREAGGPGVLAQGARAGGGGASGTPVPRPAA